MALPFGLEPEQVREACGWGFFRRLKARRAAAAGDKASAVLLVAHATAKSLRKEMGLAPVAAAKHTAELLALTNVTVEYSRG